MENPQNAIIKLLYNGKTLNATNEHPNKKLHCKIFWAEAKNSATMLGCFLYSSLQFIPAFF